MLRVMSADTLTALFLCTGNSARSILAEALLNKLGAPRFSAFSAGSHPTGKVNPLAIELLASLHYPTSTLRSKSWIDFSDGHSSDFDIVITVWDSAASESCPIWPGQPVKTHWSLPDPASVEGSHAERLMAFSQVYQELERRIQHLVNLHPGPIDREGLNAHLEEIQRRAETMEMGNERSM